MKHKIFLLTLILASISRLNCYYYENNANYDADNNEFNKGDGASIVHIPPDLLISTENHNNNDVDNEQIECKTDLNCISSHNICLNGNCVRICNNNNVNKPDKQPSLNCVYFHCDSKLLIYSDNYYLINKKLNNLINNSASSYYNSSSNLLFNNTYNRNANFFIETNNYPLLNRYLSKRKCSWILKHRLKEKNKTSRSSTQSTFFTSPFIKLKFNRFATELSNDFLYIFAGDSIYSPLIAALR